MMSLMKVAQFISNYQNSTLGGPVMKQFILQSLFFYVLPRHINIMTDKEFNLFDGYGITCVHQFPQEEECTTSTWGDSKICTSSSKCTHLFEFTEDANWNKRKWHYSQIRILSRKWYCQTLKTIRIISSEMKTLLLILSWWCFSCLIVCKFRE